ncbi:MAG TPA: ATPase domain-containing protein, partial [Streptosporangiaceae bacterium]|nr:ATPase domain-containing protein [Streptosporangiaceae bacterium]
NVRFREFMYSLVQRFSRQGITLLATCEMPEPFGAGNLSEFSLSQLSDYVIMLNYYRGRSSWCRSLAVVKARASRHDPAIRQFSIGSAGIDLVDIADAAENPVTS